MTTTTETCGKCDGKKTLSWTRNANGLCFACGGTGVLVVTTAELAAVRMPRAEVITKIAECLKALSKAADGDSYDLRCWSEDRGWWFGKLLAHADADVEARALAAFGRECPRDDHDHELFLIQRHAKNERAVLAAKVRKVVAKVERKVA